MTATPDAPLPDITPRTPDPVSCLNPRSIAVLGASADPQAIGHQPLRHLLAHGYGGTLVPVNPRHASIAGLPCQPTLDALPERPDLVVVALAAARVPEAVRQCVQRGVPLVVVLSSGFAETGAAGALLQRELGALVHGTATRVIGPNCQGFMNVTEGYAVGFGPPYGLRYPRGPVSLSSQSGAFGNTVLMLAAEEGVGFRHYVSTGNEADVTTLDLVQAWIDDPGTRLMASYVEGWRDARRALAVGRRALAAGKPWLIWKVGRTAAGARAAASHTANLAGPARLYDAVIEQVGAIAVHDVHDLADATQTLTAAQRPAGPRVAIVTVSGGAGILMADECERCGLTVVTLAAATVAQLRTVLPPFGSACNPVDLTGEILRAPEMLEHALRCIAADPGVDMVALPLAALSGPAAATVAAALCRWQPPRPVPLYVAWHGALEGTAAAVQRLREHGVPVLRTPVRCARAMAVAWRYEQARARLQTAPQPTPAAVCPAAVRRAVDRWCEAGRTALNEHDGGELLRLGGIPAVPSARAADPPQAVAQAQPWLAQGRAVVLKALSAELPHKTEAGGVHLGLRSAKAVAAAARAIVADVAQRAPRARLDGLLVQPLVGDAVEVIAGVRQDPHFGPVLLVGSGGTLAEWADDVAVRVLPLDDDGLRRLLDATRLMPRLRGWRGAPAADVPALLQALARLAAMAADPRIAELEINPLFVLPQGQGVLAGDVVVQLSSHPPQESS